MLQYTHWQGLGLGIMSPSNVTFPQFLFLLFSSVAFERSLKQIVVFVMVTVSGLVEVFLRHWGLFNKCGSLKQSKLLIPPFYVMATCGKHAKFLCDWIAFIGMRNMVHLTCNANAPEAKSTSRCIEVRKSVSFTSFRYISKCSQSRVKSYQLYVSVISKI